MGQLVLGDEIVADEFVNVAVGFYHACALALSGSIRCWGPSLETLFMIKNYTHHRILENNPDQNFGYPVVIPDPEDPSRDIDMAAMGWNFYTPKEKEALDYKALNFLPMTTKFGYTSTGDGDSGIPGIVG
jgi:hypothetical protein